MVQKIALNLIAFLNIISALFILGTIGLLEVGEQVGAGRIIAMIIINLIYFAELRIFKNLEFTE